MNNIKEKKYGLAATVAQMAHEANLIWGAAYNCAVDGRDWYKLTDQERHKKIDLIVKYGNKENVTHEQQHENWLLTAPEDHPCNVPYADLTPEQKSKDVIFASHFKLYKNLLDAYEIKED